MATAAIFFKIYPLFLKQFCFKIWNLIPNMNQTQRLLKFFCEKCQIFWRNFWFYARDQKLLLVTLYVKPYLVHKIVGCVFLRWNGWGDYSELDETAKLCEHQCPRKSNYWAHSKARKTKEWGVVSQRKAIIKNKVHTRL